MELFGSRNATPHSYRISRLRPCKGVERMGDHNEILAVIPARGGSKGIPRKNIIDLCGKPLIAYSIQAALASTRISRVVVSTDDEEIAAVSREWGAEVPFLRPRDLAEDRSEVGDALGFTLSELQAQGYYPDAMAVLYTTSPFRTPEMIDEYLAKLEQGYSSVSTARPIAVSNVSYFTFNSSRKLYPIFNGNGYRYENKYSFFRKYGLFSAAMITPRPLGNYVFHVADPVSLIDIDTPEDLVLSKKIIQNNLFDFSLS